MTLHVITIETESLGDRFEVRELAVKVLATPGHTPHHVSYIVRSGDDPPAVFTGGSMPYGTVGRTDLIDRSLVSSIGWCAGCGGSDRSGRRRSFSWA